MYKTLEDAHPEHSLSL